MYINVCEYLRWDFMKENKKTRFRPRKQSRKKKENTLSTKRVRKNNNDQEKKEWNGKGKLELNI